MWGYPVLTLIGAVAMVVIIVSTAWMADFRMTLVVGVPFLVVMAVVFRWVRRK